MSNASYWREREFRDALLPQLPPGHYTLASPTKPGIADIHFCIRGLPGWIELKYQKAFSHPAGHALNIRGGERGLSREQRIWITEYEQHGGLALVGIGVADRAYFLTVQQTIHEAPRWTTQGFRERAINQALLTDTPGIQSAFWAALKRAKNYSKFASKSVT